MKFNVLFFLAAIMVSNLVVASNPKGSKPVTYKLDAKQTSLKWDAKKVTGRHSGIASVKTGMVTVENGMVKSANFVIDMNSIQATDLKAGQGKEKLEGHLKSDDFFGVEANPTSEFKATNIQKVNGANYTVTGDLTIKGQTHSITFPATIVVTKSMLKTTAKITVDRTLYGIKYGSGSFFENLGDKAIDNEFTIDINLVAVK